MISLLFSKYSIKFKKHKKKAGKSGCFLLK